jgi:5'-3' exonuclease
MSSFLDHVPEDIRHIAHAITHGDITECALGEIFDEVGREVQKEYNVELPDYICMKGDQFDELKGKVLGYAIKTYFEVTKTPIPPKT